jgi:hypothetical protein
VLPRPLVSESAEVEVTPSPLTAMLTCYSVVASSPDSVHCELPSITALTPATLPTPAHCPHGLYFFALFAGPGERVMKPNGKPPIQLRTWYLRRLGKSSQGALVLAVEGCEH